MPAFLVAVAVLVLPGLAVVATGWGIRRIGPILFAPAISASIVGVSAALTPLTGLRWGLLPLAVMTSIAVGAAGVVRLVSQPTVPPADRTALHVAAAVVALAALILIGAQFTVAFGAPDTIAQRFDNIVHLNTVRYAIETANASPFSIGATSDIPFYPSGWHALTAVTASVSGASVPVAVNATNLAVVALIWPVSNLALAAQLFPGRRIALVTAGMLSTGFGAFPALFFNWGVLYPNALGYALIPAALASVILVRRASGTRQRVLAALLAAAIVTGVFLAHPNAFVATFAFAGAYLVADAALVAVRRRTRLTIALAVAVPVAFLAAGAALWRVATTNAAVWGWTPWESTSSALYHALTVTPRGYVPTVVIAVSLFLGAVAIVRRPQRIPLAMPFAVAVLLYVLAAGTAVENPLRAFLTDPWYSDPNRLAALLPIAAIPIATLGITDLASDVRRWTRTWWVSAQFSRSPAAWSAAALVAIGAVLSTAALGPNVSLALAQVNEAHQYRDDALLLTADERAVLERLTTYAEPGSLVIASPRTGANLAYALAGLTVTEPHIFGAPSADETFLAQNLARIDDDPAVCEAVNRTGVDYVVDFGSRDVMGADDPVGHGGVVNLVEGEHLTVVDTEGPDARVFRIEGC
ncbi:DUF6541 family protein [Microbacterium sp. HA-8]|uniref:DUF6541 family protein n=1 Tax=Microbacterium sp. HA-8 TaxID=3234200 RepID=UPI0038F6095C